MRKLHRLQRAWLSWLLFREDRRGVSAVEFALLAPVCILAYFGTAELSEAMMTQRRTSHASSAIGDLATQYATLKTTDVSNIFAAASIIMQPFSTTPLQMRMTSITLQANGKATVDWSQPWGAGMTGYSAGTVMTTIPTGLLVNAGDNIVMSEAKYAYTSPAAYVIRNGLSFSNTFYLRPRSGAMIPCCS